MHFYLQKQLREPCTGNVQRLLLRNLAGFFETYATERHVGSMSFVHSQSLLIVIVPTQALDSQPSGPPKLNKTGFWLLRHLYHGHYVERCFCGPL